MTQVTVRNRSDNDMETADVIIAECTLYRQYSWQQANETTIQHTQFCFNLLTYAERMAGYNFFFYTE